MKPSGQTLLRPGLVLAASAVLAGVGGLLQGMGVVPAAYTWLSPFDILKEVFGQPHFPLALVGAWGLGVARRTGWRWTARLPWAWNPRKDWVLVASGAAFLVMDWMWFPLHTGVDRLVLALAATATAAHLREPSALRHAVMYLVWTVAVFTLVSFGYTAVKAALFVAREPMDSLIISAESALFGEPVHLKVIRLATQSPRWVRWLDSVYFSFFDHMLLTSALLLGMRQDAQRNQFVAALVFCYLLGGPAYFLILAVGPAFATPPAFAFLEVMAPRADLIESMLLTNTRHVIEHSAKTLATFGYLACMPSLHVAHECVMVYFVRRSRPALVLSSVFAVLTVFSTLLLGWHYFLDAVGGVVLACVAITLARVFKKHLVPATLDRPDAPLV